MPSAVSKSSVGEWSQLGQKLVQPLLDARGSRGAVKKPCIVMPLEGLLVHDFQPLGRNIAIESPTFILCTNVSDGNDE